MPRPIARLLSTLALLLPAMAHAEPLTWNVSLGGLPLGQIRFQQDGGVMQIETRVDRTPLGVFDGTFSATTRPGPGHSLRYASQSRTSRKARDISFTLTRSGKVLNLAITPEEEKTDLSDPARVPDDVLDPVSALARLVNAHDCPAPFRYYDGRRVVALSLERSRRKGDMLRCRMRYDVALGPGHLSPLYITTLRLDLDYAPGPDGGQTLDRMTLRSGIFVLRVRR